MVRAASRESKRQTIYLLAGLVLGVVIMAMPALLSPPLVQLYPAGSLPEPFLWDARFYEALEPASPLDASIEVLWLVLPALIIILALYWLAIHRTRWAGYDEAAKWSRR